MSKNTEEETQHMGYVEKLQKQEKLVTSEDLLRSVSMQLYNLMGSVVESEITPKTVSAACECAAEIHKILKLNYEIKKNGF